MLRSVITIANLPARATVSALKQITNPAMIEGISTAIAKGSFATVDSEGSATIDGLDIKIEYDQDRLLATGGIATAISLGTAFWLGSKLQVRIRYAALTSALTDLQKVIKTGDQVETAKILDKIDLISDPLIDPVTFKPIDDVDQVADVYTALFDRPPTSGSMFNAGSFTSTIDDQIKIGSRAAVLIASETTDEVLEAVIKKSAPIAGKVAGRALGAVLWVDTVWWLATSAIDIGLNYTGIDEEDQKIPILSDIPFIGGLFDLSDSIGSSALDLVITPVIDGIIDFFFDEETQETVFDILWGIITTAAVNPTLAPFIIAILDFYIDRIDVDITVPASWDLDDLNFRSEIDLFGSVIKPEPLDILILWFYAISAKIIVNWWIMPMIRSLRSTSS